MKLFYNSSWPTHFSAATAVLLSACQPKEAVSPQSVTTIHQARAATDSQRGTTYQRSCLISKTCVWPTYQAALYDYVGAVYDLSGRVRYDGILLPEEKSYVEGQFGSLRDRADVYDYVGEARRKFFKSTDENFELAPQYCDIIGDHFVSYSRRDSELGWAVVLGGVHLCGEKYGELYLRNDYEFQVAAQPQDWVFFDEDSGIKEAQRKLGWHQEVQEGALFERIARVLDIPVVNPLKDPASEAVASYLEQEGVSRMETARTMAINLSGDFYTRSSPENSKIKFHRPPRDDLLKFFAYLENEFKNPAKKGPIDIVALTYGVDPKALGDFCLAFITPDNGTDKYEHLVRRLDQFHESFVNIVNTSNALTVKTLPDLIRKQGKAKALFVLGALHALAIDAVYKPWWKIWAH